MSQERPETQPPTSSFVIRMWREWSLEGGTWRGWIVHIQSGDAGAFQDLTQLLDFFHASGITLGPDSAQSQGKNLRIATNHKDAAKGKWTHDEK